MESKYESLSFVSEWSIAVFKVGIFLCVAIKRMSFFLPDNEESPGLQ